jgi:hypothetical protein
MRPRNGQGRDCPSPPLHFPRGLRDPHWSTWIQFFPARGLPASHITDSPQLLPLILAQGRPPSPPYLWGGCSVHPLPCQELSPNQGQGSPRGRGSAPSQKPAAQSPVALSTSGAGEQPPLPLLLTTVYGSPCKCVAGVHACECAKLPLR